MAHGSSAASGEQTPRIARRYKIFEATRMQCPAGDLRVHLINISETGALVHGSAPAQGAAISLDISGAATPARVVWSDGDRFGVVFLSRLTPFCMAKLIG
jgi:hypothetical protein